MWNFPRAIIKLDNRSVEPTPEFLHEVDRILSLPIENQYEQFEELFSNYGHVIAIELTIGGQLYHTDMREKEGAIDETQHVEERKQEFKAAVKQVPVAAGVVMEVEVGAAAGTNNEVRSRHEDDRQTMSTNFQTTGGNTTLCQDPGKWVSTIENFLNWRVINIEKAVPVYKILDKERQNQIESVLTRQQSKPIPLTETNIYRYPQVLADETQLDNPSIPLPITGHVIIITIGYLLFATTGITVAQFDSDGQQKQGKCPDDLKWNSNGITVVGSDTAGTSSNQLNGPRGLFFDQKTQILYIADRDNHRIQQLLPNGQIKTIAGDPNGTPGNSSDRLNQPSAIYVDENQNLFIADTNNHRVLKWEKNSSSGITMAGETGNPGSGLDQLNSPQAIWVDSKNNLYIADLRNHRVMERSPQSEGIVAGGNGQGDLPNQLNDPVGLYFDESNNDLYISNYLGHSITKWKIGEKQGTFIAGTPGKNGTSSTQFFSPSTVALDTNGNMYIADTYNHRVQLFCHGLSKEGKTIAGITGQSGNNPNQLNFPHDLALDTQTLDLYIADSDNNRIQKFSFISSSSKSIKTMIERQLILVLIIISFVLFY
ncbi:unnamed protein product [Rotaria sordida]|uniref:MACPF-like domain-containing protein n=1 Tax=Rotaria sordida TaxID=392033 RepID=A0A814KIQ3_9BILA|nr:unnamed protein product [Rotaria sordida]CAF1050033.1 unnamed protein product [Rotaria sordida]